MAIAPRLLLVTLVTRTVVHWRLGLFHGLWRYSGTRDLMRLAQAAALSSVLIAAAWAFQQTGLFPRSIFILDGALSFLGVGGLRFSIRALREVTMQSTRNSANRDQMPLRRVLIVGAGDTGEAFVRELARAHTHRYTAVGFLDNSVAKQRERIHGVEVVGTRSDLPNVIARCDIDEVIVATEGLAGQELRTMFEHCRTAGASLRIVPPVDSLIDGRITINHISPVKIEDLLGRSPVTLDTAAIQKVLRHRVIVVTGAGGSIGSELCSQICRFGPSRLVLIEQAEHNLFEIHRKIADQFPNILTIPYIADICDSERIREIFRNEKPHAVFHAAAHKHVPMMESNPKEAIKNNIFGTITVANIANQHNVESFVLVSTDKAVHPTSVMGASKRAAEMYVQALSNQSQTRFVAVRFGNVLGSTGSVLPLFQEQIAKGGPVTVTHPDMKRYFMTIAEASQLILQAASMGKGGEIFVLDMGEPVSIADLARDLIRLSGLTPHSDIAIKFTGIRPGEKLFEQLSFASENIQKTLHPKIFVGALQPSPLSHLEHVLEALRTLPEGAPAATVREALARLVPEFAAASEVAFASSPSVSDDACTLGPSSKPSISDAPMTRSLGALADFDVARVSTTADAIAPPHATGTAFAEET